ncbi:hypothetical protein F4V57_05115 [Acinetobacter qingfengensis]|uniref:Membrane-binding protein n=1 Tax=Acinetobacter qingfengensis TaxID=1262585 RepID=A0A1E7RCL6_9GAMM|nr:hypothetical protein [Acinetobacter qingfengensis]KAA8734353.1 hypothetical protein F4V57_05115 [Acinetobacter qingfengensis]OEY97114.1 hypothetical protein BJI46_10865 [Acinetobacter qingfengensis]
MLKKTLILTALLSTTVLTYAAPTPIAANQTIAGSQVSTTQAIVAYFKNSKDDYKYSSTPASNGFYRVYLARDANGRFLVQDFFQQTNKKQSDPYWVNDIQGLASFEIDYIDGPITGYYSNGNVSFKGTFKNGEFSGQYDNFYPNGRLASRYQPKGNNEYSDEYFYENGKKAAILEYRNDELINETGWNNTGSKITDKNQIQDILDTIYTKIELDQ